MVTGVNANYYNQYPIYQNQNQYGNYGNYQQNVTFGHNPTSPAAPASQKTAADGKDDGSISFGSKLKNIGAGMLKFVTGMFTDENGEFSLGQTLKTALIAGAIGAVCVLTAGTAVPAIIAAGGIALSSIGLGKAAVEAAVADTDAEAEEAWQNIGSNGLALGLSIAGAKAVAKSSHAAEAAAGKFDGVKGLWESVKTVGQDAYKPISTTFEGVKDAYQGASTLNKITNASEHVWNNIKTQSSEFSTQVSSNFNKAVYGTANKISDEAAALDKKKASLEKQMAKSTDKTSKKYLALEKQVKEIEVKQAAMNEINSQTSWQDANNIIEGNKTELRALQADLRTAPKGDVERINAQIAELQTKINTQETVLQRRTLEVRALKQEAKAALKKYDEAKTPEAQAKYLDQAEKYAELYEQANFKLPKAPSTEVKLTDVAEARGKSILADTKLKAAEIDPRTNYYEYLNTEVNADQAAADYQNIASLYRQQTASKAGGFYQNAASEMARTVKGEFTKGTFKDNVLHQNNPAQWLTVETASRQFITTPETRFYNQLSPDEQKYYRTLSHNQKQALVNTYTQVA